MALHEDMLLTIAVTAALLLFVQRLAAIADQTWLQRVGWRPLLATTGWIGVPVHEGAHALACVLTRRKIRELRLLAPDRQTGVLGYVLWEPGTGPLSWLVELLVGFAPLLASLAAMLLLAWFEGGRWPTHTTNPQTLGHDLQQLASVSGTHLAAGGWARTATLLRIYAMVAIAAHGVPSRADLQGTWRGLSLLLLAALALWGIGRLLHVPLGLHALQAVTQLCGAVLPALAIAIVALGLRWLIASLVPQR
jgi:hypothetical protein